MPIKIKKLSQLDLDALRAFIEEPFNSDGIILLSEDEGIPISIDYTEGVIDSERKALAHIRGIPKAVKPHFTGTLHFQVSISNKEFDQLNEKYFSERMPTFGSAEDLVKQYLPLIEANKKIDSKPFYARLKPVLDSQTNPWISLIEFINFGVVLPEHVEIDYGDAFFQFDAVHECLRNLSRRKRYGKTMVKKIYIKPLSGENLILEVKL